MTDSAEQRERRYIRNESDQPQLHGFIMLNAAREILGIGETVAEVIADAREWESEVCDACPFCKRIPTERDWKAYRVDAAWMDVWFGHGGWTEMVQDGTLKWAAELNPPRYLGVEHAQCILCRDDMDRRDCPCGGDWIEIEGIEPDEGLPPPEDAAWSSETPI